MWCASSTSSLLECPSHTEVTRLLDKEANVHIPVAVSIDGLDVLMREKSWASSFLWGDKAREAAEKETSHILHNIRGVVKPGQLLAILGSSGICSFTSVSY